MIWSDLKFAYHSRYSWWFTATARTRARFSKTILGNYWLGLSNLLSIISLGFVYGVVFSINDFRSYFVYLGLGLVLWNSLASAINSAPELLSHNAQNIKNTNVPTRSEVMEKLIPYIQEETSKGTQLNHIMRHTVGLFHGQNGSKTWKQYLSKNMCIRDADLQKINHIMDQVKKYKPFFLER